MNDDEIDRIDVARHLLPPPGNEVAGQLIAEVRRLREATRRLADQDATLSVCNGNVIVEMDDTLTDEERAVLTQCAKDYEDSASLCYEQMRHTEAAKRMKQAVVVRGLLERTKETNNE